MIYASSKDAIKKKFTGLSLEFQANDRGDYDYTSWADEVEKKAQTLYRGVTDQLCVMCSGYQIYC